MIHRLQNHEKRLEKLDADDERRKGRRTTETNDHAGDERPRGRRTTITNANDDGLLPAEKKVAKDFRRDVAKLRSRMAKTKKNRNFLNGYPDQRTTTVYRFDEESRQLVQRLENGIPRLRREWMVGTVDTSDSNVLNVKPILGEIEEIRKRFESTSRWRDHVSEERRRFLKELDERLDRDDAKSGTEDAVDKTKEKNSVVNGQTVATTVRGAETSEQNDATSDENLIRPEGNRDTAGQRGATGDENLITIIESPKKSCRDCESRLSKWKEVTLSADVKSRIDDLNNKYGVTIDENGPSRGENGLSSDENGPSSDKNGPSSGENGPSSDENGPSSEDNGPSSEDNGPSDSENGLSSGEYSLPSGTGSEVSETDRPSQNRENTNKTRKDKNKGRKSKKKKNNNNKYKNEVQSHANNDDDNPNDHKANDHKPEDRNPNNNNDNNPIECDNNNDDNPIEFDNNNDDNPIDDDNMANIISTERNLRICQNMNCDAMEPRPKAFLVCSQCRDLRRRFGRDKVEMKHYCSQGCANVDWQNRHKEYHGDVDWRNRHEEYHGDVDRRSREERHKEETQISSPLLDMTVD